MKLFRTLIGLAALALLVSPAVAQTVPRVSSISPGVDLIQIIPNGQPTSQSKYATVSQVLSGNGNVSGLRGAMVPLTEFKAPTGIPMTVSATSTAFGVAITAGTSEHLISNAANSTTVTDTAGYELVLPSSYVAGQNVTVTINCNYTLGSGTIGTHTLTGHAYPVSAAGVQSADIVTTASASVPSAAGNVTFTIPGTNLVSGSDLWVTVVMVIQDTGGSNITGQINSASLS